MGDRLPGAGTAVGLLVVLEEGRLSWGAAPTITCKARPNRQERQHQAPLVLIAFHPWVQSDAASRARGDELLFALFIRVSGCILC